MVLDFCLASCLQTDEGLLGANNKEIGLFVECCRCSRATVESLCELKVTHQLPE